MQEFRVSYGQQEILSRTVSHLITVMRGRNDADGFAAKLTCGEGNRFYGCISHNNIDDGWDLYAKSVSGTIGSVTIENCVAYNNGWLTTDDVTAARL